MSIIKDGTGTKRVAKVDATNKLQTRAVTEGAIVESLGNGDTYLVSSPAVTLTTACTSHILFLKNNDDRDLLFDLLITVVGPSTGGTTLPQAINTINPVCGTLICCGTVSGALNLNLGSSKIADITVTTGTEGSTITGALTAGGLIPSGPIRLDVEFIVSLPKGQSISFGIKPPASNTNMEAQIVTRCRYEDPLL